MSDELRRGAGVLRDPAGRDRRLLLRGLSGSQARERRAADGRQAERERRSHPPAAARHPGEDVAGVPESAHLHRRPGLLLRHRVLHRCERVGERGGDRAVRESSGSRRHPLVRRTLQNRVLLPRHRVRDDLHGRVPAQVVRRAEPVQVRALRDVDHRRRRDTAVLHRARDHRQRRRIRGVRDVTRVPRVPYLQVLAPLAGTTYSGLHP